MKKIIFIYISALLAGFIIISISFLRSMPEGHVVYLKDGSTIEAEEAWEVVDEVFFIKDDDLGSRSLSEVERIGKIDFQYLLHQILNRTTGTSGQGETEASGTSPIVDNYLTWLRKLLVLAFLGAVIIAASGFLKAKRKTGRIRISTEESYDEKRKNYSDREKIVDFFLNLFKIQLGAGPDAKTSFLPVASKSTQSHRVYELRVKNNGDHTSRRMTIGILAEESGSKSKCFDVTYDDHLVVKIPPVPVRDFDTYLESIKGENHIVERLSPKQCIIPRVSVILKRIPSVFEGMGWSKEEFEEKCIERLKKFTKYQKYLMIDGSFIYFMDLSKYYFLGNIIREIHDIENQLHAEITGHPGVIWEPDGFERRYGSDDASVCDGIRKVFTKYEENVNSLLATSELSSVLPYQIQGWFLTHLGGHSIPEKEKGLTPLLVHELNGLLKKLFEENPKVVDAYRHAVKEHIRKTSFMQHKAQMTSVVSNLLELLGWLGEKGVAMRDLKPDNLLVAGEPSDYPNFLNSPETFEIGLIDVETAVILEAFKKGSLEQPMLAGTPLYATPSHLFENNVLEDAFNDLPRILHFQDWHATVAIIYNVITGEHLFSQTAKLLPTIRTAMQKSISDNQDLSGILKDVSRIFWKSAADEFQAKTKYRMKMLNSAMVKIPQNALEMLKNQVSNEFIKIGKTITSVIESQDVFTSESNRQQLRNSSYGKIQQFKEKIEKQEDSLTSQLADKEKTVKLLENLGKLKLQEGNLNQIKELLETSGAQLVAYQVIELMFTVTSRVMYPEQWNARPAAPDVIMDSADAGQTIEATIEE